jgi:predicted transposase YbfD/YdcC
VWIDLDNADYIRETLGLPGCQIALRVDRQLRAEGGEVVSHDVRYFISSLDPEQVTPADLLRHVRSHWRVENGLHFLKDRWWDEDRHYTRRKGLSACMAAINNAALSIHRLRSNPNLPVRAAADHIAWSPARGLELLNS